MNRLLNIIHCAGLCMLLLCAGLPLPAFAAPSVSLPNGTYSIVSTDLQVKTTAGWVGVTRSFNGSWSFNPQWESLSTSFKNPVPSTIDYNSDDADRRCWIWVDADSGTGSQSAPVKTPPLRYLPFNQANTLDKTPVAPVCNYHQGVLEFQGLRRMSSLFVGVPLYEYARAGLTLEREARPVTVHQLQMLDYLAPDLRILVRCSKGTYIRVLGGNIGHALGCGAHLTALRRTVVGHLDLAQALTLEQLAAMDSAARLAALAPADALLSTFPAVTLDATLATRFLHGQRLALGKEAVELPATRGRVRVYAGTPGPGTRLLGSGQLDGFDVLAPERLVSAASA